MDAAGHLVRPVGGVNINEPGFRGELTTWVTTGRIPEAWQISDRQALPRALTPDEAEADARFQRAIVRLTEGDRAEAVTELKRAFRCDPENYIIRKQLWAIEHPEAFYAGDVDYAWQARQKAREDAELRESH